MIVSSGHTLPCNTKQKYATPYYPRSLEHTFVHSKVTNSQTTATVKNIFPAMVMSKLLKSGNWQPSEIVSLSFKHSLDK